MSKRIQLIAVLLAWLLSTGAQWDLVQTFGWARMVSKYAQTMSLTEAVKKTFSGEMCGVCEIVSEAKQQEHDKNVPSVGKMDAKILLVLHPVPEFIFSATESEAWSLSDTSIMSVERGAPPLPPPRV